MAAPQNYLAVIKVVGIGGGGVAIPLAMTFFNFSMKPAIAVSSFSIMISTLARFFLNFSERHPEKKGCTSIDYNMTNVMMPLTLMGSMVGAYIYVSFPELYLQITLTLLLLLLTVESGRKGLEIYKKESIEMGQKNNKETGPSDQSGQGSDVEMKEGGVSDKQITQIVPQQVNLEN